MKTPVAGSRWIVVASIAASIVAANRPVCAQGLDRSAIQRRLADSRPLGSEEIDQLLAAVRRVAGGKPFRFTAEGGDFVAEILFEADGHVRFIRNQVDNTVNFTEYTGRIARYCDGTVASGELVFEYRPAGTEWSVNTRASSPADLLRPVFDMLVGLKSPTDRGLTGEGARALSVDWNRRAVAQEEPLAGGRGAARSRFALADPSVSGFETLEIDPMTLLPVRWDFTFTASRVTVSYRFDYDGALKLEPPKTAAAPPACIELPGPGLPPAGAR